MNEEQAIRDTLESYAIACCAKDIKSLMKVFVDNDEISVIGTGADELCEGREQVKNLFLQNFEEATATRFEWLWSTILINKNSAVVAVSLTIHLECQGELLKIPIRWSVVCNKNEKWLWVHRHASSAAGNQDEGKAYPAGS